MRTCILDCVIDASRKRATCPHCVTCILDCVIDESGKEKHVLTVSLHNFNNFFFFFFF